MAGSRIGAIWLRTLGLEEAVLGLLVLLAALAVVVVLHVGSTTVCFELIQ